MKKVLTVILSVVVVAAAFYFFYKSFEEGASSTESDVLEAVPQSAAMIFETRNGLEIPRALAADNLIYEQLKSTDLFFRIDALLGSLDSALANTEEFREVTLRGSSSLSVHRMGAKDHAYLLVFRATSGGGTEQVADALNALFRPAEAPATRSYDGVTLYASTPRFFDRKVHYYIHDGLVGLSFSSVLIEESVRALLQSASVMDNRDFRAVRVTRSSNARGELYVHYESFAEIMKPYTSESGADAGFFAHSFAEWSAFDFNTKANAVRLNGFALAQDSGKAWLNAFRQRNPVAMELAEYMPSNTAYFAFFGYEDFAKYHRKRLAIIERSNRAYSFNKTRQGYDERCDCDMEALAAEWIGSQAATFIVEPVSAAYDQNRFAAFMARDGEEAVEKLRQLADQLAGEDEVETEEYQGRDIFRLGIGDFYADVLGKEFDGLSDPYVTRVDDVVLMGRSLNAMRVLINAIDAHRTLARDDSFRDLIKEMARESNLMIYSSLSRSPAIYQHILKSEHAQALESHTSLLRKFQAFVYQVSHYKGDLYYNQAFLRYHPGYSPETNALWEARIEAPIAYPPTFFTNHYTGDLEILVQDTAHRLYLMDNMGRVLWKRNLPERIRGDIHRVDVYKNDKFQIFFGTDEHLYLIDRKGRNVEGFPVKLSASATAPVAVADYDRSRDYRFFVPVRGGDILCFDSRGNPVQGWDFDASADEIVSRIRHIRIGKKDYLFALQEGGKVLLLDRRGSPRHEVTATAEHYMPKSGRAEGRVAIDEGEDISASGLWYCDSLGAAYRLGFDDRLQKFPLTTLPVTEYDISKDPSDGTWRIATLSPGQLGLYDGEGAPIYETDLEGGGYAGLQTFDLSEPAVGVVRAEGDRIYLYDRDGRMRPGFPLFGATEFAIGDMNGDGYYNLITAGSDGFIYAYAIE